MLKYDVLIIGAGLVGLGAAHAIQRRYPSLAIGVVEKEPGIARHQSTHNSGVIHAGVYYAPGSLKARLCVAGAARMRSFCRDAGIKFDQCGKVIVATSDGQLPALQELHRRAVANGLSGVRWLNAEGVRAIEPDVRAVAGIHVPETAVVNYGDVAETLAERLRQAGVTFHTDCEVVAGAADRGVVHTSTAGEIITNSVINCAGLYADIVARRLGADPGCAIIPFRGEYYNLQPSAAARFTGLVYPVPDPRMPFLGVHLTRRVDGSVEAGPNAVMALAREGYGKTDLRIREAWEMVRHRAFWNMVRRYWRSGVYEYYRSWRKSVFARDLQLLAPGLSEGDLAPGGAGVRAQAVGEDGSLLQDFRIVKRGAATHVLNAPSPAATASLEIGDYIAALVFEG